jgi:hypothetical protein
VLQCHFVQNDNSASFVIATRRCEGVERLERL